MDHRRFILFLVFFFSFSYLYNAFVAPRLFPRPPQQNAAQDAQNDGQPPSEKAAAEQAGTESAQAAGTDENSGTSADATSDAGDAASVTVADHPARTVTIGSLNIEDGYYLSVNLTSAGAAIENVRLSPEKFRDLKNRDEQVMVLGNNQTPDRTFTTAVSVVDQQLAAHGQTLESTHWEVTEENSDHVVFTYVAPDGSLKLEKRYSLTRVEGTPEEIRSQTHTNTQAWTVHVDFTVTNLSDEQQTVDYEIQGPVGVILENREHTRKYRDIKMEFLTDEDDVHMGAKDVVKLVESHIQQALTEGRQPDPAYLRSMMRDQNAWTGVIRYAGVDVQFFASLIAPLDERPVEQRLQNKWIARTYPVLIERHPERVYESDISFRMASSPQALPQKGSSFTHSYGVFVGPKYETLLDPPPFEATRVLDIGTGFFSFFGLTGVIARVMHLMLGTFYSFGIPYGVAIILLTVLVRSCMFPITRKQAISAARMKALQPKLNELKEKYADDKQKLAQAQMELWRKYNINPLGGCLPVVLQMPIFIGLYQCLNTAVDLRLSRFLWIDNLAAPDALFQFPFDTPAWVGPHLNVLPLVTVVLFLLQQKMFMPPPADEQAEMTQKMMNMMTFVFGAFFWHQPAGLCLYFICSSLWGIAERKLLSKTDVTLAEPEGASVRVVDNNSQKKEQPGRAKNSDEPQKKGFMARLMEAAEEAQRQAEHKRDKGSKNKGRKGKGKGGRNN